MLLKSAPALRYSQENPAGVSPTVAKQGVIYPLLSNTLTLRRNTAGSKICLRNMCLIQLSWVRLHRTANTSSPHKMQAPAILLLLVEAMSDLTNNIVTHNINWLIRSKTKALLPFEFSYFDTRILIQSWNYSVFAWVVGRINSFVLCYNVVVTRCMCFACEPDLLVVTIRLNLTML